MKETNNIEIVTLLSEIRDNQLIQIEMQSEALSIQREQFAILTSQYEKSKKLSGSAENVQEKSRQHVDNTSKMFKVVVPLLAILLAYLTWLMVQ